jgi:hypothetical protein
LWEQCNDADERTTSDVCNGVDGICKGVDLCAENAVTCSTPPSPCHEPTGTCFRGNCSYTLKAANASCDDGEERTDFDT